MMNEATLGADDSFMTVGEMSSTTIDNCVLYSAPESHELSMAFNSHHLKVDYEDGQKWTITSFDFEELKRLYHTWGKAIDNSWRSGAEYKTQLSMVVDDISPTVIKLSSEPNVASFIIRR